MQAPKDARITEYALALGARIRQGRKSAGLSQAVLAERCQIYRSYLTNIEAGKANPSLSVILSIAIQLDIQPWQLMKIDPLGGWRKVGKMQFKENKQFWEFTPPVTTAISAKNPRSQIKG